MPVTASRFSALTIEDDSDVDTIEKPSLPAATANKQKLKRSRKRNKERQDSDLQAVAFGYRRGSKTKSGNPDKTDGACHRSDRSSATDPGSIENNSLQQLCFVQDERDQFDRDIQQALLQSKLEFEKLTVSKSSDHANFADGAEEAAGDSVAVPTSSYWVSDQEEEEDGLSCNPSICQSADPLSADISRSDQLLLISQQLELSRQQCEHLRDAADKYKRKFRRLLALMRDCEVSEKVRLAVTASKAVSERDAALKDNAALSSQLASLSVELEEERTRSNVLTSQLRRTQEAKRRCHDDT